MATNGKIFETELAQGSSNPKYLRAISSDGKSVKVLASQFAKQTTQTQINTRVTTLEGEVDELQTTLPAQVAQIGSKLGDLTQLQTTDKSNLVGAINELNSGKASQAALTALSNAVAGKASQSELTALSSQVSGNKSDSDAAMAALNGKIGNMSALETESKSTLVEAINEATASVSVTIVGDTMVFNRGALVNGTVLMIN